MQKNNRTGGFTLIELSIVLVIIGLLAGGVMAGQDLIHAATIRAQISQIEKYNTEVRTFQLKYGYLLGDIPATASSAYGFFSTGMTGAAYEGDGNGLIQDCHGGADVLIVNSVSTVVGPEPYCEALVFWRHLSDANLIDGTYGAAMASGGTVPSNQVVSQESLWLPPAKLRGNISVYSMYGKNFYQTFVPI